MRAFELSHMKTSWVYRPVMRVVMFSVGYIKPMMRPVAKWMKRRAAAS